MTALAQAIRRRRLRRPEAVVEDGVTRWRLNIGGRVETYRTWFAADAARKRHWRTT